MVDGTSVVVGGSRPTRRMSNSFGLRLLMVGLAFLQPRECVIMHASFRCSNHYPATNNVSALLNECGGRNTTTDVEKSSSFSTSRCKYLFWTFVKRYENHEVWHSIIYLFISDYFLEDIQVT